MKSLFYFLFTGMFAVALFLGACQKVVYPPIEVPIEVSYSADVQPIFSVKCIDCHKGSLSPDLRPDVSHEELTNGKKVYVDTINPPNSLLMQKLYGSHDARATESEKQTILVWIEGGALNN